MTQHHPPAAPPPLRRGLPIVFGLFSAVATVAMYLGGRFALYRLLPYPESYSNRYLLVVVLCAIIVLIGIIGAIALAGPIRTRVAIFAAVQGVGLALVLTTAFLSFYIWLVFEIGIVAILLGAIGVIFSAAVYRADHRGTAVAQPQASPPLGYTDDGQPVYPVVGYTPEGKPVTADRVQGYAPARGTNAMAITALILALVATPLAIPFGHIARSQIRRTDEQGAGMALAALIIGYVWLGLVVIGLLGFLAYLQR